MLLNPLSFHRLAPSFNAPLVHLRHRNISKLKIFCNQSHSGELSNGISENASKPATRSSRGSTRKSLGLNEAKSPSLQLAQDAPSEPSLLKEREGDANPSFFTKPDNAPANPSQKNRSNNNAKEKGISDGTEYSEAQFLYKWAKRNRPAAENIEHHVPNMANSKEFSKRIQDLINADLERRYKSDDEDNGEKDPLFVEEDDPYWLDEPDDGWGFKVSDLFKENFGTRQGKKKKERDDDDDDVSNIPDIDWDFQPEKWSAKEVDSASWAEMVFDDPSPLIAFLYERYGRRGRECYHMLRELEEAANVIWDSKRLPPRLVKVNVSFEEDLTAAIGIKEVPTLLFIKAGKMIHHQAGYLTADNLMRIMSYFYHGGPRPPCLKNYKPAARR